MDTKNFKNLCDRLLKKYGFKKKKTMYYKDSNDGIRCGVYLQRSYYGKVYYFNYYYFLDNSDVKVFPQYFEADVYGRITVLSKIKENNSYYQTELIKYELYEEKELEEYLEKGIQDEILLPVKKGRQVIYDMVKIKSNSQKGQVKVAFLLGTLAMKPWAVRVRKHKVCGLEPLGSLIQSLSPHGPGTNGLYWKCK